MLTVHLCGTDCTYTAYNLKFNVDKMLYQMSKSEYKVNFNDILILLVLN
jgi:hypothetical protein